MHYILHRIRCHVNYKNWWNIPSSRFSEECRNLVEVDSCGGEWQPFCPTTLVVITTPRQIVHEPFHTRVKLALYWTFTYWIFAMESRTQINTHAMFMKIPAPQQRVLYTRTIGRSNRLKFGHVIMPFWWRHRPPDFRCDAKFAPHCNQWQNGFTSTAPEPNVRSERPIRRSNRLKFGHPYMPFWWRHRPPDFRCDAKFAPHCNQWQNGFTSTPPEPNMRSERSIRRSNRLKFGHLTMPFWWRHRPPDFPCDAKFAPHCNQWQKWFYIHCSRTKHAIWAIDTAFEPAKIRAPDHAILWRHRSPDFRCDAEFAPHCNQWQNGFTSTAPEPNVRSERPIRRSNRLKFGHPYILMTS